MFRPRAAYFVLLLLVSCVQAVSVDSVLASYLGHPATSVTVSGAFQSLTGTLPQSIGLLTAMTDFDFSNNLITSTIPSEIGLCLLLKKLSLQNNQLSGPIPSQLSLLTALTSVELFSNQLTGNLNLFFPVMTSLRTIDVRANLLDGTMPSVSLSLNLQSFRISSNQISGTLPSFSSHPLLLVLEASSLNLFGSAPDISASASLSRIDLSNNQGLVGVMPQRYQSVGALNVSLTALEMAPPGTSDPINPICYITVGCLQSGISRAECSICTKIATTSSTLSVSASTSTSPTPAPIGASDPSPVVIVVSPSSPDASPSTSPSRSVTPSGTPSTSPSTSVTPSGTPSTSPSTSITPSTTRSVSPSSSITPTGTPSTSPSNSVTPSGTPSTSPSTSITPSTTRSVSPSTSITPTGTPSSSPSITPSTTPSVSNSVTPTGTPSTSPSLTTGISSSVSPSSSVTPTRTTSVSPSNSVSPSASPTLSVTPTPTQSTSPTQSLSPSASVTATPEESPPTSNTPQASSSNSLTVSPTTTTSPSTSASVTSSVTQTRSQIQTQSNSLSTTTSPSAAPSPSVVGSIARGTFTDVEGREFVIGGDLTFFWNQEGGGEQLFRIGILDQSRTTRLLLEKIFPTPNNSTLVRVNFGQTELATGEMLDGVIKFVVVALRSQCNVTAEIIATDFVAASIETVVSVATTTITVAAVASVTVSISAAGSVGAATATTAAATTTATTTGASVTGGGASSSAVGGNTAPVGAQGLPTSFLVNQLQFMAMTSYQRGPYPTGFRDLNKSFLWTTLNFGSPHSGNDNAAGTLANKSLKFRSVGQIQSYLSWQPEELLENTVIALCCLIVALIFIGAVRSAWKCVSGHVRFLGLRQIRLKLASMFLRVLRAGSFGLIFAAINQLKNGLRTSRHIVAAFVLLLVAVGLPSLHVIMYLTNTNRVGPWRRCEAIMVRLARAYRPLLSDFDPRLSWFIGLKEVEDLVVSLSLVMLDDVIPQSVALLVVYAIHFGLLSLKPYNRPSLLRFDACISFVNCVILCVPLVCQFFPLFLRSIELQWILVALEMCVVVLYVLCTATVLLRHIVSRSNSRQLDLDSIAKDLRECDSDMDSSDDEHGRTVGYTARRFAMEPRHEKMWDDIFIKYNLKHLVTPMSTRSRNNTQSEDVPEEELVNFEPRRVSVAFS